MFTNNPVLLLNADRSVITTRPLHRILSMYYSDHIYIVKTVGDYILHPSLDIIGIPIVASLKHYVVIPYRQITLSKKRVFQRDQYVCQYCEKPLTNTEATIDHIVPKSHKTFPGSTWENMVTSCKKCNNHKGGRTPEEAKMILMRKPFRPRREHIIKYNNMAIYSEEWKEFLDHETTQSY